MAKQRPDDVKARAVALSLSVGVLEAGRQLGLPHRTISLWRQHPKFRHLVEQHRTDLGVEFRLAVDKALASVLAGLDDPKANLGHRARALEVLTNSWQLVTGQATERIESRTESVTVSIPPPVLDDHEMALLDRYVSLIESGAAVPLHERIEEDDDHA